MKKLTGIVSEFTTTKAVKKGVPVFKETFRSSNAIAYVPTLKPAPQAPTKRERLKSLALGMTVTAFLLSIAVFGISTLVGNSGDKLEHKVEWVVVSVGQGDTMWDLVREHETNHAVDTRELINLVKKHNNLKQPSLQVGMTIEIPVIKEEK